MAVWVKALLGGVAGIGIGALIAVLGVLAWLFCFNTPHFKNDSEAMGFDLILAIFVSVAAVAGAYAGAFVGVAIALWKSHYRKLAIATLFVGTAIATWAYSSHFLSSLLLLPAIALIIWHLVSRKTINAMR